MQTLLAVVKGDHEIADAEQDAGNKLSKDFA
jgi:hypothetical protein